MHYIEFPALGLHFNISPVAISIGGIDIYWYGIIISMAVFLGFFLATKKSTAFGYTKDDVVNMLTISIPSAIVGARLYYVIFNSQLFKDNLFSIFNIRTGGLAIYGGIIGAMLAIYAYCRYKGYKFLNFMDVFIPYLALGQSIGRWGNFTNQEAFGTNTKLFIGMTGDLIKKEVGYLEQTGLKISSDIPVHPTFLYESVANMIIFLILVRLRKNNKLDGNVLCTYMILYGISRFFIEGLRIDSLMFKGLRISQVLSAVIVVAFLSLRFLLERIKRQE